MTGENINVYLARETQRVMRERNWSLDGAEIATGVKRSTIQRMRNGQSVKAPTIILFGEKAGEPRSRWEKIALGQAPEPTILREDAPSYLPKKAEDFDFVALVGHEVPLAMLGTIPLAANRATASMSSVGDGGEERLERHLGDIMPVQARAIVVAGDSMEPVYQNDDVLIVIPPEYVHDGDEVIAHVGEGVTCKVFRANGSGPAYLEPYNGEGRISEEDFFVCGVVTAFFRRKQRRLPNPK